MVKVGQVVLKKVKNVKRLQTDGQTDGRADRGMDGRRTTGDYRSSIEPLVQVPQNIIDLEVKTAVNALGIVNPVL